MRCITVLSFICGLATCLLFCAATGTNRWKEHLDVYKMARKYIGLWQMCLMIEPDNYAGLPAFYDCDKDFLRPHRIEPPNWFIAIRVLMLLSCLLSFFGCFIMAVALATDRAKKRGSTMWPAALTIFVGGLLGLAGLIIFTVHEQWNVAFNYDGSSQYFADYWWLEPDHSIVNNVFFKIELWYRWSFGLGWGGVGMSLFTFIVSLLSDVTRRFVNRDEIFDDDMTDDFHDRIFLTSVSSNT